MGHTSHELQFALDVESATRYTLRHCPMPTNLTNLCLSASDADIRLVPPLFSKLTRPLLSTVTRRGRSSAVASSHPASSSASSRAVSRAGSRELQATLC